MIAWKILLSMFLSLDLLGILTLRRNAYVKVNVQGKSLKPWVGGLINGSLLGTVIFGIPFFVAAYFAGSGTRVFVLLGMAIGTCMPMWLDFLLTLRHSYRQSTFNAGKEGKLSPALLQVLGMLLWLSVLFVIILWISTRTSPGAT